VAGAQAVLEKARGERLTQRIECERAKGDPIEQGKYQDVDCERTFSDRDLRLERFLPHTFSFHNDVPPLVMVFGGIVALFGFAVGASSVGAEWTTGGMTNLLLWRPRRLRVLGGKLAALLAGVAAVGVAGAAAWLGLLALIAATAGRTVDLTADFWQSLGWLELRAVTLAVGAAALGFGLASLGRNTATALGIGVGYAIVGEVGARIVLLLSDTTRPERFFLSSYAEAWLRVKAEFTQFGCTGGGVDQECASVTWYLNAAQAAFVFGMLLIVVIGAAAWRLRRRDVT